MSSTYTSTSGRWGTAALRMEDCIIGEPGAPRFPEPAMYITHILRKEWKEVRCKPAPSIDLRGDLQGYDFTFPQIVVYNMPSRQETATVDAEFKNEYHTVVLDCWSKVSQGHAMKMVREAERCINKYRVDTFEPEGLDPDITGRHWLNFGERVTPQDKNTSGFWRRTAEVKVYWRYRHLEGDC